MVPKVSLSKRPASTRKEPKIQLELEIKDNNDVIDMHEQIYTLAANQKVNYL